MTKIKFLFILRHLLNFLNEQLFETTLYQTILAKMQFWHHQTYKTSLMKFGLQFECNCLLGHLLLGIVVVVDYF